MRQVAAVRPPMVRASVELVVGSARHGVLGGRARLLHPPPSPIALVPARELCRERNTFEVDLGQVERTRRPVESLGDTSGNRGGTLHNDLPFDGGLLTD